MSLDEGLGSGADVLDDESEPSSEELEDVNLDDTDGLPREIGGDDEN